MVVLPLSMAAQFGMGKWVTHSRYAIASAQNIVDAGDNVYYLVCNNLYRFNKTTKQQEVLNQSNSLNGLLATGLYYNPDKGLVFVTYDDSNIDIIKSDGSVVNVPDLKNAIMYQSKTINDISFAPGKAYVATNFGYLVIDDSSLKVTAQKYLNVPIASVAEIGDMLIVSDIYNAICYGKLNRNYESLGDFIVQTGFPYGKMVPLNNNTFLLGQNDALTRYTITPNQGDTVTFTGTTIEANGPDNIQKTNNGFIANFTAKKYYYTIDGNGNATKVMGGNEMYSCYPKGDGTMWSISDKGLHSSSNISTYYMPNSISISNAPWWMVYSKPLHKLYLNSTTDNGILGINGVYQMNTYDGSTWINANPTGCSGQGWYSANLAPGDSTDTYYISGRLEGVYKITNNKVVAKWTTSNAPFIARKPALAFDSKGNLWAVHTSAQAANTTPVKVLPKEKLNLPQSSYTTADWITFNVDNVAEYNTFKGSVMAISKMSDIKAVNNGDYGFSVVFWENNSDVTDGVVKRQKSYRSFTRKDGSVFTWTNIFAMTADNKDNMCLGAIEGLIFLDASKVFDDNFTVYQPKELNGITVYCVAIDSLNRKWVGTNGSGIFLLSEDCSTVLNHFTTDNSPLLTNVIYNLCCNTDNNSVFIVTPIGVQQYFSDYTPAAENYNNVFAFPNPVRPNFTGLITISGLMDNSTVIIKDSKGNVVKQLTSTGGLATWDGCDSTGERLPTGSYQVYASQNASVIPNKPFTKIMIIK